MYSDDALINMSDRDALKLNRNDRRRRDRLLSKSRKSNIASFNQKQDKVTVSQAELKRMIDEQVKIQLKDNEAYKSKVFQKTTFDFFYLIVYFLWTELGFGHKRMSIYINKLFDLYDNVFDPDVKDIDIKTIREAIIDRFKMQLYCYDPETDTNIQLDNEKLYQIYSELTNSKIKDV